MASKRSGDGAVAAPSFLALEAGTKKRKRATGSRLAEFDSEGRRKSAVLYIGRVPHGFYEDQMREYFSQFGEVKRLRISRNKKTGRSKHYAFVEFESPEVASIVAESMDNYLIYGRMMQVKVVPVNKIHPALWKGANKKFVVPKPAHRQLHNKEKSLEKRQKMVEYYVSKDQKRREKLKAVMDYEYPELVSTLPVPKKIIFET